MSWARVEVSDLPPAMQKQVAEKLQKLYKPQHVPAEPGETEAKPKKNKYGARKTKSAGITFDSRKEAQRYELLMMALSQGWIEDLKLQVEYVLQAPFTKPDGERVRAIKYVADFVYKVGRDPADGLSLDDPDRIFWGREGPGAEIIEDVKTKATRTRQYMIKKKLMAERGFDIREV